MGNTFNTGRLINGLFVDASGNVGIGTTTPAEKLSVIGNIRIDNGSADGGQLVLASSGFSDWNLDNFSGNFRAYYGATERMRLTNAGNLAIGTTSPITFTNYNTISVNGSTGGAVVTMSNGTSALRMACGTTDSALWEPRNVDFAIGTNNTERMRITSSGNVGIGTSSPSYRLDVATTATNSVFAATTTFTHTGGYLDHSAFLAPNMTGGALSVSFGKSASNYNTGKFVFNYAGDGSTSNSVGLGFYNADNLLVVRASGNVGIGTSSPLYRAHIISSNNVDGLVVSTNANDAETGLYIRPNHTNGTITLSASGNTNKTFIFNTGNTEAMRITSGGSIGIGLTNPGHKVEIWNTSHNVFRVVNTGSANGNSPTAQFLNSFGNHSWGITAEFRVGASGGEDRPSILFSNGFDNNTWACGFGYADSSYFRINRDQGPYSGSWGVTLFSLDRSGNYSFSGSNVSDRRNKKDIVYISDSQLDTILKLRPATFVKKSPGKEEYSEHTHTGFIAQDILEDNIPNLVHGSEEKGYGLDYDGILALAVKAIQELKAEVDILKNK